MYINDISILYYLAVGLLGLVVGQFVDWCNIRLLDHKKVFCKDFFSMYLKNMKIKYIYMVIMSIIYIMILYTYGFSITTIAYGILAPMIMSALIIDYKEKIIPNRLNLTIFEVGLVYTFIQGIININVAINMILGMIVGFIFPQFAMVGFILFLGVRIMFMSFRQLRPVMR